MPNSIVIQQTDRPSLIKFRHELISIVNKRL